jgi:hypothetical protein
VSSDGNTALIGVLHAFSDLGTAYVFTRSGDVWTQQAQLFSVVAAPGDQYGASVALSGNGNTALVGSLYHAQNRGSVAVFTRSETIWSQQIEISASDGQIGDYFGVVALSSDGNTALIGAHAQRTVIHIRWTISSAFSRSTPPRNSSGDAKGGWPKAARTQSHSISKTWG